jgi:hypothetical protein
MRLSFLILWSKFLAILLSLSTFFSCNFLSSSTGERVLTIYSEDDLLLAENFIAFLLLVEEGLRELVEADLGLEGGTVDC